MSGHNAMMSQTHWFFVPSPFEMVFGKTQNITHPNNRRKKTPVRCSVCCYSWLCPVIALHILSTSIAISLSLYIYITISVSVCVCVSSSEANDHE